MNKKAVWIVIAIVVLLAAAWGIMASRKKNSAEKSGGAAAERQQNADNSKLTSLKELEAMTSPQKCVFKDDSSPEQAQGVMYISKGRVRGDFGVINQGKTVRTHMISDGKYSYTWMDDSANGFKVAINEPKPQQAVQAENQPGASGVDANKQMSYDCQAWSEDANVFSVPANINFQDLSALSAPPAQPAGTTAQPSGGNAAGCAACDTLQGDARTQCRTALSCK